MSKGFAPIGPGSIVRNDEGAPRRKSANARFKRGLLRLFVIGGAVWLTTHASQGNVADTKPVKLSLVKFALAGGNPTPPAAASDAGGVELDRMRISSQTWRRGGLGSKAMVTFTVRNDNDYAVKDVEIVCAFARRDGSHLTDRSRVLADTVGMKSRKTFAHVPVGFVNVNADQAKCSLVRARRA
ncbi:hypothetical protein [Bradyrhizobium sp. Gha]|uniref:hypothetical protein n=1 Tax=Bradyrhizobium sp. Gha TaxID=1855318 RepID=UPI0008E0E105|nr:hypothetical protein [Bradyrhizobium sp. Gha]SFJ98836.1 hypothetical protein SAMN05216525_14639 [Bradyrhizobium sp. Gha]